MGGEALSGLMCNAHRFFARIVALILVFSAMMGWSAAHAQTCSKTEAAFANSTTASETYLTNNVLWAGGSRIRVANSRPAGSNFVLNTNEISDSHFTGEPGIQIGHSSGNGNSFANRYETLLTFENPTAPGTFKPVSNLTLRLHDIDAGDVLIVNAYDQNNNLINLTASNYSFYAGTVVSAAGNQFTSTNVNTPDNSRLGTVDLNFNGLQVSRILFQYYDTSSSGTYTIAEIAACGEASVQVRKTTVGGTGTFGFTGNNGLSPLSITTVTASTPVAATAQTLTSGIATTITESTIASGYALTGVACTRNGTAFTPTINLATRQITIPAANMVASTPAVASNIVCTFTNTLQTATLQLVKAWGTNSPTGNVITIGATTGGAANTNSFNATSPNGANSGAAVTVVLGNVITLPAEIGANIANYNATLTCTGSHTLSGSDGKVANTLTITSTNAAVCTYTNQINNADLVITKSNTASVVDEVSDTVVAGPTTYTIRATNNGPNSVTGAVIRDTVVSGLNCPGTNAVTITGSGVPAGSFTISDLTGAGITLGTLTNGQTAILSFQCTVL